LTVVENAPAKINLGLKIIGKRTDGYHNINSIFQTIDIYDELEITSSHKPGLICSHPEVPTGPENLVLKAENLLARNAFGDLTLKMRYLQKPSIHKPNDPIISINPTHLSFSNSELVQELKIKNSGEVALKFEYLARFDKSKESMATFFTHTFNCIKEDESELYWSMPANTEITIEIGLIEKKIPEISPGTYKGEILILSNDPVNPYISVPFDIVINL